MQEELEKIEKIDMVTMYKMIQALHKYDYYSTKCFVHTLLQKRRDKQEIKNLKKIEELLFYQKDKEVEVLLEKLIDCGGI